MRQLIAYACVGLLALSAPALAQSTQSYGAGEQGGGAIYGAGGQGAGTSYGAGDTGGQTSNGTDAYDQAPGGIPGFGNVSPFLVIGGIAGGAGLIAYAVSQNQNNNNPASP